MAVEKQNNLEQNKELTYLEIDSFEAKKIENSIGNLKAWELNEFVKNPENAKKYKETLKTVWLSLDTFASKNPAMKDEIDRFKKQYAIA